MLFSCLFLVRDYRRWCCSKQWLRVRIYPGIGTWYAKANILSSGTEMPIFVQTFTMKCKCIQYYTRRSSSSTVYLPTVQRLAMKSARWCQAAWPQRDANGQAKGAVYTTGMRLNQSAPPYPASQLRQHIYSQPNNSVQIQVSFSAAVIQSWWLGIEL